jgi:hypothetical protein
MEKDNAIKPFMKDCPVVLLSEREYEKSLMKFGSFLYLINNKNINPTFIFINLVKEEKLQKIFMEITGANTLTEILQKLLTFYPNLIKSKMVKEQCIKIVKNKQRNKQRAKNANRPTKNYLQHASSSKSFTSK